MNKERYVFKAKILDMGRVTVPWEIREKLNFRKGDTIILQVIGRVLEKREETYFTGDEQHDKKRKK